MKYKNKIDVFIANINKRLNLDVWFDGCIPAGGVIDEEVKKNLNESDVILLLISPDYVASYYCYEIELKCALQRHENGLSIVIPIVLRDVPNISSHPFSKLKMLPADGRPITKWRPQDSGYANAFTIIFRDLEKFIKNNSKYNKNPNLGTTYTDDLPGIKISVVKSSKLDEVALKQSVVELLQSVYIKSQNQLQFSLDKLLQTYSSRFRINYNKGTSQHSDRCVWRKNEFRRFITEMCGLIQKHITGEKNTVIHVRFLKDNFYETFANIGYDEPCIPKVPIPYDYGTIYLSTKLDYPIIKSYNRGLHNKTHPNESLKRDYITFTFGHLVKTYGYKLSMCISFLGVSKPQDKNLLLLMSIMRLDYIIEFYIEKYLELCIKIDKRTNYKDLIGGNRR